MRRPLSSSLLAWLRSFEAAARHGSFTRAAAELCVTQGAVSQQVKQLEASVGVALFARGPRSLTLTRAGRALAPRLADIFTDLHEALDEIDSSTRPVALVLSCSPSFALRWLGPRLATLPTELSAMDLRLFGEFHRLDRARMVRDELEVAVRYDALSYPDLSAIPFLDEFLVAVARPGYASDHGVRSPADLDGRMLLHDMRPWEGVEDGEEWSHYARALDITIRNVGLGKRYNLSQMAIDSAIAGEGVAIGRLALVLDDLEAGRLTSLFELAVPAAASYKLVCPPVRSPRTAAVQAWLDVEAKRFRAVRESFLSRHRIVDE